MKELKKDTRIALLMGGPGSEREVSITSGKGVLEALLGEGFTHVTPVLVDSERPAIPEGTELCYNMIHGTYGEDGGLQSYLEELDFPTLAQVQKPAAIASTRYSRKNSSLRVMFPPR